jgi:hypothetical protein
MSFGITSFLRRIGVTTFEILGDIPFPPLPSPFVANASEPKKFLEAHMRVRES